MEILNYITNHIYEFFGVFFSIIYVILSIKQNIWCWPALIIAAILNGYAFFTIGLPLQSVMQLFFIIVGLSGLKNWSQQEKNKIIVRSWKAKSHFLIIFTGSLLTLGLFTILKSDMISKSIFESKDPFFDALMFMFNIIPMYMTTKKILESWLYFIWIDVISGFFYLYTGDYFYCFLFFFYIPFAIHGYLTWRKDLNKK
jgi:nicotinamide mononucleotide transporter